MKKKLLLLLVSVTLYLFSIAQDGHTKFDNTIEKNWPADFNIVSIRSSADSSIQNARFYTTRKKKSQPLIVSLHTWSGNYNQEDQLSKEVQLRDWNYIHPDFRGPNKTPQACGSGLVVADIEDAIRYAVRNANVDTNEIHIVGVSGGGFATLLAFMELDYPVKSFNAWAAISNLEDWYWECKGRGLNYARDLELVTKNGNGFDPLEARRRSPFYANFSPEKRKGASLNMYAGIHDGYTGSVPISQSFNFFNKLIYQMSPGETNKIIDDSSKISFLSKRINPSPDTTLSLGGRKVYLLKEIPHLKITLFEGTHEMLTNQALALIPIKGYLNTMKLNILTIGDSNGELAYGWPVQLQKLLPYSTVINKSISGNTIGFDNINKDNVNTLKNIDKYLAESLKEIQPLNNLDYIFICLGTNDAKKVYQEVQKEVANNMIELLSKVRHYFSGRGGKIPNICIISTPPMDEQKVNKDKYEGGNSRVQKNNELFKQIARKSQCGFLNIYDILNNGFSDKTKDGIHFDEETQFQFADEILTYLNKEVSNDN